MAILPLNVTSLCTTEAAIHSCLNAGMIVIVEVDSKNEIIDIDSAHVGIREAYDAIRINKQGGWDYVVLFPTENFPAYPYEFRNTVSVMGIDYFTSCAMN